MLTLPRRHSQCTETLYMRSRSTASGKRCFSPYFGAKVFECFISNLRPGDHLKCSYGSVPIHLDRSPRWASPRRFSRFASRDIDSAVRPLELKHCVIEDTFVWQTI